MTDIPTKNSADEGQPGRRAVPWRKHFPILIIDPEWSENGVGSQMIHALASRLIELGHEVLSAQSTPDREALIQAHSNASAVIINADIDTKSDRHPAEYLIARIRSRNSDVPIFLCTDKLALAQVSIEALRHVRGYFWKQEDTPAFIAGHIDEAVTEYLDRLLPPFFSELVKYSGEYKYSWHTPGHSGGVAFLKSPVGQAYFQFFGENMLRADLSVSVPELGSLLEHSGVIGDAEREAARTFGADRTYFVTNGTSTANKIVWHANVTRGDAVLVDRNCHKSILHAIIMTGAVPVYLPTTRNAYGIIGPIPKAELAPARIAQRLAEHPLLDGRLARARLAVMTNSTYDGLAYDVHAVSETLADTVNVLHFDEAWFAYARFHPFYSGRFGMSATADRAGHPTIFATQSTHKLLAALSQASMVHVRESDKQPLDADRFNEAFMMHTSTSPQYGIIASLDVASRMMAGAAGQALIEDVLDEALLFRRRFAQVSTELPANDWWFSLWQPPVAGNPADTHGGEYDASDPRAWLLTPAAKWHGFDIADSGYALLDPTKVTVLTPGVNDNGGVADWGIPAAIVARFLWNRGLVVEKTGLYSFLILFSIGVTKGKWGSLLAELFEFKSLFDANAPLEQVFPALSREHPGGYAGLGLADLCRQMHQLITRFDALRLMRDVYTEIPEPTMTPAAAYEQLVRGQVEAIDIDALDGRTAAVMVVPYPPGIPLIMPGERFNSQNHAIRDYLAFCQGSVNAFPGFGSEVHGVATATDTDHNAYTVSCVLESRKNNSEGTFDE
ncbi:MAG: hypothetical protein PF501_13115 [Salinisphaera sp.]|nr:hypothetical protein [Salinisphaera sp.]